MNVRAADIVSSHLTHAEIDTAPKCQANARDQWLQARQRELLPTRYVHVVFTLPHELAPLALQNKRIVYDLLFRLSAETLLQIAHDPEHLGAEIGFFSVLHSWNQKLEHHPHIHCVVPAGGLSPDHTRWITSQKNFFLPVKALGKMFRGKFREALKEAFLNGQLSFHGSLQPLARPKVFAQLLRQAFRKKWVVYCSDLLVDLHTPSAISAVTPIELLSRITGSSHSLTDQVTFRWRDSAHNNKQCLMTLPVTEFLRRFLLHVLPPGFVRIRHFGFLSTRNRSSLLPVCFRLLGEPAQTSSTTVPSSIHPQQKRVTWLCPHCNGPMLIVERLSALQLRFRDPPNLNTTAA